MNGKPNPNRTGATRSAPPAWWLVFTRELSQLWIGGRALNLTLIYTVLVGVYAYGMANDSLLSLIPPQEMVYEMVKAAMASTIFVGLIIGADSLSGERERATLESLLLTPTSRTQIVLGKFLAAVSPWPVAFAISVPYWKLMSQGNEVFGQAVLWGAVFGSLLAPAFTALGMLVSFWSNTNKQSMFVSLGLYLLFLLPTQLPGRAQTGAVGMFFQWLNPMQAPNMFLARTLVNNRTIAESWEWFTMPISFVVVTVALLIWYASPGLRLEAGRARGMGWSLGRATGLLALALLGSASVPSVLAQEAAPPQEQAPVGAVEPPLRISIDMDAITVKAGDPIRYNTVVTNPGGAKSPPLIVAMNIINLKGAGEPVDPEDWSPQRTQYLDGVEAGGSVTLSWRVNAILDGDFMVYMVVIPEPAGPDKTSNPAASPGIHLTVQPFTRLNPGGVLPYAIGGPILVLLVLLGVYKYRHREIDTGAAS
ncbi:MAG TPA: ABC transporter permease subunit [Vicinamibacteria bacterium]|nr:ABC transporter permease subunit [Vicinamibacteria bacterium]